MGHPGLGPGAQSETASDRALRLRSVAEQQVRHLVPSGDAQPLIMAVLALEARLESIEGRLAQIVRKS